MHSNEFTRFNKQYGIFLSIYALILIITSIFGFIGGFNFYNEFHGSPSAANAFAEFALVLFLPLGIFGLLTGIYFLARGLKMYKNILPPLLSRRTTTAALFLLPVQMIFVILLGILFTPSDFVLGSGSPLRVVEVIFLILASICMQIGLIAGAIRFKRLLRPALARIPKASVNSVPSKTYAWLLTIYAAFMLLVGLFMIFDLIYVDVELLENIAGPERLSEISILEQLTLGLPITIIACVLSIVCYFIIMRDSRVKYLSIWLSVGVVLLIAQLIFTIFGIEDTMPWMPMGARIFLAFWQLILIALSIIYLVVYNKQRSKNGKYE